MTENCKEICQNVKTFNDYDSYEKVTRNGFSEYSENIKDQIVNENVVNFNKF